MTQARQLSRGLYRNGPKDEDMQAEAESPRARPGPLWRNPFVLAAALGTLGLTVVLGLQPLVAVDTDMWWHLAHGRLFVEHGIPHRDPFSFSSDVPLIAMEWLYDVMTYCVYRLCGDLALVYIRLAALLLDAMMLFWLIRTRMRTASVAMDRAEYAVLAWMFVAATMLVTRPVFLVRPQIFMWSMFMTAQFCLYAYLDGRLRGRWMVVCLGSLTVIWVNLHPTWLLIPGTLGIRLIADVLSRRFDRMKVWVAAIAATTAASLLNPGGLEVTLHPFAYMVPSLYTRTLVEYQPPPLVGPLSGFHAVLLVDAITMAAAIRRRDLFTLLMLLGLTRQGLSAQRYIPFLCFFLTPVAAAWLGAGLRLPRYRDRLLGQVCGWIACLAIAVEIPFAIVARLPLERVLDWRSYPVNAVSFLLANQVDGRIYNAFEWGGWLTWALPPGRVFIDGRCFTVYSDGIYRDYLEAFAANPGWSAILDRYSIDLVLLNKRIDETRLGPALESSGGWTRIFDDEVSTVYLRNRPDNAGLRARLARTPQRPDSATMDDADGMRALHAGQIAAARAFFEHAVAREPWLADAQFHLGMALAFEGRGDEAAAHWEEASRLDPTLREVHFNLGIWAEKKGDTARAIYEYQAELAINPAYTSAIQRLQRLGVAP